MNPFSHLFKFVLGITSSSFEKNICMAHLFLHIFFSYTFCSLNRKGPSAHRWAGTPDHQVVNQTQHCWRLLLTWTSSDPDPVGGLAWNLGITCKLTFWCIATTDGSPELPPAPHYYEVPSTISDLLWNTKSSSHPLLPLHVLSTLIGYHHQHRLAVVAAHTSGP